MLFNYLLRIADTNLIMSHRLSEWCGHGPVLEEDLALTNTALDLMGMANSLLQYAAKVEGKGRTEDDLAFLRREREFFNTYLSEQPNGDYAFTIMRSFLHDAFDFHFYTQLQTSKDETLAALASKSLKEATYHLRHTSTWVQRLGDGTEESHQRTQKALNELWRFTDDMFDTTDDDKKLIADGIAADLQIVKANWQKTVTEVLSKATLQIPAAAFMQLGSRTGKHTEYLGYLLAEMQHLHRAYPGAKW
jgi:ring-1,2-phenylacetyl-CoA epoxidase subunit PaaC